jgi:uncharacterized protein YktA (UPF0223 family)
MTLAGKIEFNKAIVSMDIGEDNHLLTIDEDGVFKEFLIDNHSLENKIETKIKNSVWNRRVSFSKDGEYIVYAIPESNEISVFSKSSQELLYTIGKGFHQGEVISTVTDFDNKYFISTSRDGRAFLWNIQTGNNVFSFPKMEKSVNISRFDTSNEIVALGSEDGIIKIFNISSMKPIQIIKTDNPIRGLLFLSDKYLISLDKENRVTLWRYEDGKEIKVLLNNSSTITRMKLSQDDNFLFLTTIKGAVILYNLVEHEIVNPNYINLSHGITNIVVNSNGGDITLSDMKGGIYFYSGANDHIILAKYIKAKKYGEAYKLIQKNSMLKFTKEAEILEMIWKKVLEKSEEMLEDDIKDTIKIELMLEPFTVVPEKKEIVKNILEDFKQYAILNKFIDKESYYLAYDVIEKHPALEKTRAFKRLESIWQDHFRRAKSILFEKDGESEAKDILSKFGGVAEKSFTIKNLFQQKNTYQTFQNLLKGKRYNQIINYVENNRFLETNGDYQQAVLSIDDIFIQMKLAIKEGNFDFAREKAEFLKGIDDFRDEAIETLEEIKVHKEFQKILPSKDLNKILSMVEEHSYLKNYAFVKAIEKRWNNSVFEAQELASHGEIDSIQKKLKDFYPVVVRHRKMANIFKIAYLSDLHNTIKDNEDSLDIVTPLLKRGVEKYINLFGVDQEIEDLIEEVRSFGGERIEISEFQVGNIDEWTPEKVQYSIIQ